MNAPIENPKSKIANFLAAHSTLALATINADGLPESAPLFFAVDNDGSILFVSSPKSRHSLNITADSRAAVTVHNETWTWEEIAGVQMEGEVHHLPAGSGREHAW